MTDTWDLLAHTMEKVNDCLGDYWLNQIQKPDSIKEEDEEEHSDVTNHGQDDSFEDSVLDDLFPQPRARSNTWPRRQLGLTGSSSDTGQQLGGQPVIQPLLPFVSEEESDHPIAMGYHQVSVIHPLPRQVSKEVPAAAPTMSALSGLQGQTTHVQRKNSRRNPWGNCSYSDLIEQAISTAPDQRLTLNQIYDWLISNVSYFSERQDNAASSGWKNSIRHNLSLHQRFVKVPNQDAGKSSWWTINHDQKNSVKQRRRATFGESSREKMKKRAETARARGRLMRSSSSTLHPSVSMYSNSDSLTPFSRNRSNSSEASSSGDTSEYDNRLSPFRARSYSNASSASQSSVAQLSEFHGLGSINDDLSTDLEEIDMSDLSLGCDFIREYLSPATTTNNAPMTPDTNYDQHCSQQNVTILEPRDNEMVCQSVMNNWYQNLNKKACQELDEKRKNMIENELSHLIQEKIKLNSNCNDMDNETALQAEFDLKIQMLQEELDKLERFNKQQRTPPILNNSLAF